MSSWRTTDDKAGAIVTLWRPLVAGAGEGHDREEGAGTGAGEGKDEDEDEDAGSRVRARPCCGLCAALLREGGPRAVLEFSHVDESGRSDPMWRLLLREQFCERCAREVAEGLRFLLGRGRRGHQRRDQGRDRGND